VPCLWAPPHERWLDTAKLDWYFAKGVSDEFPTLEVALAAAALWLGYRSLALGRAWSHASARLEALGRGIEHGDTPLLGSMAHEASASWLRPLIRTALAGVEDARPVQKLRDQLAERAGRAQRRLRAAAARDLVVCSVMGGSLVYAYASNLGVEPAFYGLGALAAALLLFGVFLRLDLARRLRLAAPGLSRAVTTRDSSAPSDSPRERCRVCGNLERLRLSGDELGPKLAALGLTEALFCPHCGHLSGRRSQGELSDFSVQHGAR
jgi:hypothetical protein